MDCGGYKMVILVLIVVVMEGDGSRVKEEETTGGVLWPEIIISITNIAL